MRNAQIGLMVQKTYLPKTIITFNPNENRKKEGRITWKKRFSFNNILCLYNIGKDIRKCCLGSSWIFMKYICEKNPDGFLCVLHVM